MILLYIGLVKSECISEAGCWLLKKMYFDDDRMVSRVAEDDGIYICIFWERPALYFERTHCDITNKTLDRPSTPRSVASS